MSEKRSWLELVLLAIIAAGTIVTAAEIRMVARDGLALEISIEDAQQIADAYEAAREDMAR